MKNFVCFIVAAVALVSSANAEKDVLISLIEEKLIASSFLSGQNQILASGISPKCKDLALTNLAVAQANAKVCDGTMAILSEVGGVLDAAFNSTADLITDLNTVVNGIPSCVSDRSWFNVIGIISCMVGQVRPIWNASVHFINFRDYYMGTFNKIGELMDCLKGSKAEADQSVKKIVSMAKLCQIH